VWSVDCGLTVCVQCDHKFCRLCLKKRVVASVATNIKVFCPVADCNTVLSVRDVKELLPEKSIIAPTGASHVASTRLMAELEHIDSSDPEKNGYSVEPVDDNLYVWEIRLFNFDKSDGKLYDDINQLADKASALC
jgi:hypothetical protein